MPGEPGFPPRWWQFCVEEESAEQHLLRDSLERFLFSEQESQVEWGVGSGEPESATDGPVFSVARPVFTAARRAILRAGGKGAPSEQLDRLHVRLDEAARQLAEGELDRTVAVRNRLLQDIAHDIRSPLNSILFLADALHNQQRGELNEVQSRQVGVLYTAAVSLVKLVNDLIDYARMQSSSLITAPPTSFSVESVLRDLSGLVGPLVAQRGVELRKSVNTGGLRTGHPQLLGRVLLNLVSNAIAAAGEGGTVSVHVGEGEDGALRVEVMDDGVGTDVESLRRLISEPDAASPGLTVGWTHGLGLSICARLVAAADGQLDVRSQAGEGTVFSVCLPFPRL